MWCARFAALHIATAAFAMDDGSSDDLPEEVPVTSHTAANGRYVCITAGQGLQPMGRTRRPLVGQALKVRATVDSANCWGDFNNLWASRR